MQTTPRRTSMHLALALSAVVALAAMGAGAASARPHGHGHGFDMLSMLETRVNALDLDEAKRAAVYAVIDGAKPAARELQAQLKTEHEAMRGALQSDTPDEATLMAHADRIGEITTELRKQQLRTLLAVHAQLTPEQREALRPKHGERSYGRDGKHGGRGAHGRHGGPGGPGGCADKDGAKQ